MRIAIIDGSEADLSRLKDLLSKELRMIGFPNHTILSYSTGEELLENWDSEPYFVIISEIEFPGMNGIELARKIRERDQDVPILFFTTSNGYAMESYDVEAIGYIQKPLNEEKIAAILRLMIRNLDMNRQIIYLPDGHPVIPGRILYVKHVNHRCVFYINGDHPYSCAISIGEADHMLSMWPGFQMTQNGFIVNFNMVESLIQNAFLLKNGHYIPIAKGKMTSIKEAYRAFCIMRNNR